MIKQVIFLLIVVCFISCNERKVQQIKTPKGMVWVQGKTFLQGAKKTDKFAMPREKPAHKDTVDGFYI